MDMRDKFVMKQSHAHQAKTTRPSQHQINGDISTTIPWRPDGGGSLEIPVVWPIGWRGPQKAGIVGAEVDATVIPTVVAATAAVGCAGVADATAVTVTTREAVVSLVAGRVHCWEVATAVLGQRREWVRVTNTHPDTHTDTRTHGWTCRRVTVKLW